MSYNTVATAQTYFDTRLDSDSWDDATNANKIKALSMAQRLIDRLNFIDTKLVSTQSNEFPRTQIGTPTDILYAECEIAISLLIGRNPGYEKELLSQSTNTLGPVSVQSNPNFAPEHIANGIPSADAWQYLKPYLLDPRVMKLARRN